MEVKIEQSWKSHLALEFEKQYFKDLSKFVRNEYTAAVVYPPPKHVFRAFELCPFDQVEVVILGQDPYHGPRQANGLSFAVDDGMKLPPSLQNIFKEIAAEYGVPFEALAKQGVPFEALAKQGVPFEALARKGAPFEALAKKGDLSRWATQGVLLLNATLTVKASMPGSHQGQGWEEFTDAAVKALSQKKEHLVFMLWGNYAKNKGAHIDRSKHLVLEAAHPSPFSAHNGFFGCNHFKLANEYLKANGRPQIDWL